MAVELATAYVSLVADTSKIPGQVATAFNGVERQADSVGKSAGDRMTAGIGGAFKRLAAVGVGAGLTGAFGKVVSLGNDYTTSLNTMNAVSTATAAQMAEVSKRAKELGNDISLPNTSASDAAAAMTELAKGGFSVDESMKAAKGTLQLAAAAQIDAASAATIQSQALQSFGKDADYAATAADVLANTANASSAEITDVAYGLQASGAVAHQFGLSMEDTATSLALFANSGIQGSDAGTLLKSALLALTDQGKPAQAAIGDLGLTVYDAQGKFVGLSALFGQLQTAAQRMTPEMYQAATTTLFGSDAARLAGIAAEQGSAGFEQMHQAIEKQGSAAEVAAAKTQGLPGAFAAAQNSAETLALGLYDLVDGPMEKFATTAADSVSDATPAIIDGLSGAGNAVGGLVGAFRDLPGMVQVGLAGLVAAKFTTAKFGDELDAFSGKVRGVGKSARGGIGDMRTFVSLVGQTRAAARDSGDGVSRLSASMQVLGTGSGNLSRIAEAYNRAEDNAGRFRKTAGLAAGATQGVGIAAGGLVSALGGPWGIAITGAVGAVGLLAQKHQEAAQRAEEQANKERELQATLDKTTGAVTRETLGAVAKDFQERGVLQRADSFGIDTHQFLEGSSGLDNGARDAINARLAADVRKSLAGSRNFKLDKDALAGAGIGETDVVKALQGVPEAVEKYAAAQEKLNAQIKASGADNPRYVSDLGALSKSLSDTGESAATLSGELNGTANGVANAAGKAQALNATINGTFELTKQGADTFRDLGVAVKSVPDSKTVIVDTPTAEQEQKLRDLGYSVEHMPNGTVKLTLNDEQARTGIEKLVNTPWSTNVTVKWAYEQMQLSTPARQSDGSGTYTTITGGHVGGRATGGPVFGAGGPTSDSILTRLSNNEHVLTSDEVDAAGGHSGVYKLRQEIRAGALKRAEGGPVTRDGIQAALDAGRSKNGNTYVLGGTGPDSFDCSGFVGWLQQIVMGVVGSTKRLYTTYSLLDGATAGLESGLGPAGTLFQVGVSQEHMAATIAGHAAESGGAFGTSGIDGGRASAQDSQFPSKFHLPNRLIAGFMASKRSGGKGKRAEWDDGKELDLESAKLAVQQAEQSRNETNADADKSNLDMQQAEIAVKRAQQRVLELQTEKDDAANGAENRPAPEAPALAKAYTDAELDRIDLQSAVDEARERRNEVYDDAEATESDRLKADAVLARAQNRLAKGPDGAETFSLKSRLSAFASEAAGIAVDSAFAQLPSEIGESRWATTDWASLTKGRTFPSSEVDAQQGFTPEAGTEEPEWVRTARKQTPKVFDNGGWLQPGEMGINLSSKPEPIFNSPDQLRQFAGGLSPAAGSDGVSLDDLKRVLQDRPNVTFQVSDMREAMRQYQAEMRLQSRTYTRR